MLRVIKNELERVDTLFTISVSGRYVKAKSSKTGHFQGQRKIARILKKQIIAERAEELNREFQQRSFCSSRKAFGGSRKSKCQRVHARRIPQRSRMQLRVVSERGDTEDCQPRGYTNEPDGLAKG